MGIPWMTVPMCGEVSPTGHHQADSPTVSRLVTWPRSFRTLTVTFFSERSTNKLSWKTERGAG